MTYQPKGPHVKLNVTYRCEQIQSMKETVYIYKGSFNGRLDFTPIT